MAMISDDRRSRAVVALKIKRLIGAALLAVSLSPIVAGSLVFSASDTQAYVGGTSQASVFIMDMVNHNYTLVEAHRALKFMEDLFETNGHESVEEAAYGGFVHEASRYLLSGLRNPDFSNFVLDEIINGIISAQSDFKKLKFWNRVASILYWGGTPFNSREIKSRAFDEIYNLMQANTSDPQKLELFANLTKTLFPYGIQQVFSSSGTIYNVPRFRGQIAPPSKMTPRPPSTMPFDGEYIGVSRESSKTESAPGSECPPNAVPPSLTIWNGIVQSDPASWQGTVTPQGVLAMRNRVAFQVEGQIDGQGVIRGQGHNAAGCAITFVWRKAG